MQKDQNRECPEREEGSAQKIYQVGALEDRSGTRKGRQDSKERTNEQWTPDQERPQRKKCGDSDEINCGCTALLT